VSFAGPMCRMYCMAYKLYRGSCKNCRTMTDYNEQTDKEIQELRERLMKDREFLEDSKSYYTKLKRPNRRQLKELEDVNKALEKLKE